VLESDVRRIVDEEIKASVISTDEKFSDEHIRYVLDRSPESARFVEEQITYMRGRVASETKGELENWIKARFWLVLIIGAVVSVIGINAAVFPLVQTILKEDIATLKTGLSNSLLDAQVTTKLATKSLEQVQETIKKSSDNATEVSEAVKTMRSEVETNRETVKASITESRQLIDESRGKIEQSLSTMNARIDKLGDEIEKLISEHRTKVKVEFEKIIEEERVTFRQTIQSTVDASKQSSNRLTTLSVEKMDARLASLEAIVAKVAGNVSSVSGVTQASLARKQNKIRQTALKALKDARDNANQNIYLFIFKNANNKLSSNHLSSNNISTKDQFIFKLYNKKFINHLENLAFPVIFRNSSNTRELFISRYLSNNSNFQNNTLIIRPSKITLEKAKRIKLLFKEISPNIKVFITENELINGSQILIYKL